MFVIEVIANRKIIQNITNSKQPSELNEKKWLGNQNVYQKININIIKQQQQQQQKKDLSNDPIHTVYR